MNDLERVLTHACQEADANFQKVGGGTKHWVRECFMPALEAHNAFVGVWVDAAIKMPPPMKVVYVATLCELTNEGWLNLAALDNDGVWWICDAMEGDDIALPTGFRIVAWQYKPEWPEHIYKTDHRDPDEPILLKDGSILDPVTREVVNHLPSC